MGSYRRLEVWRKSHELGCAVYVLARGLPPVDRFGLGDQLRRASISIGANIAEGCGRNGDAELGRFISIALGSANELRYLLEMARDVGIVPPDVADTLVERAENVCRMLSALAVTVRRARTKARTSGRPLVQNSPSTAE